MRKIPEISTLIMRVTNLTKISSPTLYTSPKFEKDSEMVSVTIDRTINWEKFCSALISSLNMPSDLQKFFVFYIVSLV